MNYACTLVPVCVCVRACVCLRACVRVLHLKDYHIYLTMYECVVVRINLFLSLTDSQGETPALTELSTITCSYSHTVELNPLDFTGSLIKTQTTAWAFILSKRQNTALYLGDDTRLFLLLHLSGASFLHLSQQLGLTLTSY